ncbi:type VI secretion system protein TssA, partial [Massilia sp. MS-15]|nr:type VI secretion system protein TssA [Massilia sp. MS-15]
AGGAPPQGLAMTAPGTGLRLLDGPLHSREQALAQLRGVAEFFRRTEPHSPVAYLAEKAARWGEQPLHAWLRSVIKDDTSLARLEELLGIESEAR